MKRPSSTTCPKCKGRGHTERHVIVADNRMKRMRRRCDRCAGVGLVTREELTHPAWRQHA